jgi:hypothetical protein
VWRQSRSFSSDHVLLKQLVTNTEKIMTQLDDLIAIIAKVQTDTSAAVVRVVATLSALPATPDLTAAIASLTALDAQIQSIDVTPAPTPPAA